MHHQCIRKSKNKKSSMTKLAPLVSLCHRKVVSQKPHLVKRSFSDVEHDVEHRRLVERDLRVLLVLHAQLLVHRLAVQLEVVVDHLRDTSDKEVVKLNKIYLLNMKILMLFIFSANVIKKKKTFFSFFAHCNWSFMLFARISYVS